MNLDLFHHLLAQPEGERLEFKEWKRKGDAEALGRYCCAPQAISPKWSS